MKKTSSITALGVIILLVASPYMSISRDWKNIILMLSGVAIIVLSIILRTELHKVLKVIHGEDKESIKDTYVENNPQ
jgi:hypothetical protein